MNRIKFTGNFWPLPLLVFLAAMVYSNSLNAPYYLDDETHIVNNAGIRMTGISVDAILRAALQSPDPHRPVANVTFAINYYLGGVNVAGYHIVNIAIHIGTGILLYWFAIMTLRLAAAGESRSSICQIAFFVALLWLLNPVQVQSVTYIVQRMNSLAAFFYLLSFTLYIKGRLLKGCSTSWSMFAGSTLAGLLALGSKENAVTLPFFVLLYEWYFFQGLDKTWLKRHLLHAVAVLICVVLLVFAYFGFDLNIWDRIAGGYRFRDFSMQERVFTEWRVVVFYLGLLIYPHPSRLSLETDFPVSISLMDPLSTLFSLVFIVAVFIAAVWIAKRQRLASFCILWFLGNLVIESSIIPLEIIFEHRLYLPSMGIILLAVVVVYRSMPAQWAAISLTAIALTWGSWTYERNAIWGSKLLFHEDAVAKSPSNARAQANLGAVYILEGRMDDALGSYSEAIRLGSKRWKARPSNKTPDMLSLQDKTLAKAYYNRGSIYKDKGKLRRAIADYSMATRIYPDIQGPYLNRGNIYLSRGHYTRAIKDYGEAIRIQPGNSVIYFNRSFAFLEQNEIQAALADLDHTIALKPDFTAAYQQRGILHQRRHDLENAIDDFRKVVGLDPFNPDAHRALGQAYQENGNYILAEESYLAALELAPLRWKYRTDVQQGLDMVRDLK